MNEVDIPTAGVDSEVLCTALLEQMRVGVLAADSTRHVTFLNRRAGELIGASPETLDGLHLADVLGRDPELANLLTRLPPGAEQRSSLSLRRRDGSSIDIGFSVTRGDADGLEAVSYLFVFRDLDSQRQIELELRRAELQSALGRLLAGLAHELRNPLAGLRALAEGLLGELAVDDNRREYTERMLPLVERGERIIRAAVATGLPRVPARRLVSPGEIAKRAIDDAAVSRGVGTGPQLIVDPDVGSVVVDPEQVAAALVALLDNAHDAVDAIDAVDASHAIEAGDASEAADAPSCVRIEIERGGPDSTVGGTGTVWIRVIDRGPGIDDHQLGRLFEPFFSTKPNHCGLGLSVAQGLVRANNGRLAFARRDGETCFSAVFAEAQP